MSISAETPIVCLMGPTGAGKTACALALAEHLPIEVVSVDSALVYRGLDIGTAKPDPVQRGRVRHHLIDICDPAESYSAARFRQDARACIEDILARGRLPLLVGGTGLYFRALLDGLAELPVADPNLRARLAGEHHALGTAAMHARLQAVDPLRAVQIHPNDPQRILRALEVFETTGYSMSRLLCAGNANGLPYRVHRWVLAHGDRAALYRQLAARFHGMLERGLVNEVIGLRSRADLDLSKPAMRAVGYRAVWRYLAGELNYAEMVDAAITATRQLAKRQVTWFRRDEGAIWWDSATLELTKKMLAML